ncbi:hypothetical protein TNCV_3558261 [Trichonephila clavipes]|uniref:Uncharacterized protein n=1 Tax=Trichonephila clavipes TaxID=2585209 RepID=A0A8X6WC59_TRICX|nr:hypothetical protein TNCV_3558261 [Trichonephila clavipes]
MSRNSTLQTSALWTDRERGSLAVKVSDRGELVTNSSSVLLMTRRVGERCTLNMSRVQASSRWCGVVVRRGRCQLRCRPRHLTRYKSTRFVAKSSRVAKQHDVNSITWIDRLNMNRPLYTHGEPLKAPTQNSKMPATSSLS